MTDSKRLATIGRLTVYPFKRWQPYKIQLYWLFQSWQAKFNNSESISQLAC